MKALDRRPWLWLLLGAAALGLAQVRASVGLLAWVAPVPWLRYLRLTRGWRARLGFGVALFLAWTLATAKIASEPMFLALAPLFALPIAIAQLAGYLTWDLVRERVPPALSACSFALGIALGEWALYAFTPFGSWGATAYSQLDDLPLLQAASIVGICGIGLVVDLFAASLEGALAGRGRGPLWAALGLVAGVHVVGSLRLTLADVAAGPTVEVAAIATDSDVRGLPLPTRDVTHAWDRALLQRTREAARGGAVLAVWPEAATLVWPDEEADWTEALRTEARESAIDVVAAYVAPTPAVPFRYRNEYRLFLSDGTAEPAYAKHHPVPGEPAIAGRSAAPAVDRPWGRISGAICYDYDFPALALERARAGVDLVAVPASDWRGIDPVHAQMATLRGLESGHSVLRSTRWGLSLAADPYGRIRAWHSGFEPGTGILFAELPRARVRTLYSIWGDGWLVVAAAVLAGLSASRWRR